MKTEHLQRCQVATPHDVVSLLWRLALSARGGKPFESVIDLGAGDARFARDPEARFHSYLGIERDPGKIAVDGIPPGARVIQGDALNWKGPLASLAIGNPPFIKSANLDSAWRDDVLARLEAEAGVRLKRTANLFVLFLLQSLLRTKADGLVVQLVPYEWVTRPSASELRAYVAAAGWDVQVYRFNSDIFPRVLTTASVVVIDKSSQAGQWRFGEISRDGEIRAFENPSGTSSAVLPYAKRHGGPHALRGLSPGGQDIFVLTEEQRLHFSLRKRRDVSPCVTTLRNLSADVSTLDSSTFQRDYVEAGARCWLIRSDRENRSPELSEYLLSVGDRWRQYSTCTNREDWTRYAPHPKPVLLVSSGFVGKAPKIVVNAVGAVAVGSVYAVVDQRNGRQSAVLAQKLRGYDFDKRVVHHANNLKKIEVRQLNAVLQLFHRGSDG